MHYLLSRQICRNTPSGTKHLRFKGHHSKRHWCDKHEQLPYLQEHPHKRKNCNLYQLYHVYEDNQLQPTMVSKYLYSRLDHPREKIKLAVFHDEVKKKLF